MANPVFVDLGGPNNPYLVNLALVERIVPVDDGTLFVFASVETVVQIPFSEVVLRIKKVLFDGAPSRESSKAPAA